MKKESKTKLNTIGELLADIVSEIGSSWKFLMFFMGTLGMWIGWNTATLTSSLHFDPNPFPLLNLMLGIIASIQAPIIMMASNRQAEKDRVLMKKDYELGKDVIDELKQVNERLSVLNELIKARKERLNGHNN